MSASSSTSAAAAPVGSAQAPSKTMGFPNIPRYHPTASAGNIPWVWDGFALEGQGHWFVNSVSPTYKPWMAPIKPVGIMTMVMFPPEVQSVINAAAKGASAASLAVMQINAKETSSKAKSWEEMAEDNTTPRVTASYTQPQQLQIGTLLNTKWAYAPSLPSDVSMWIPFVSDPKELKELHETATVWRQTVYPNGCQVAARIVGVGLMPAIVRKTTDKGIRVELWLRDPPYWQENKLTQEMIQALSQAPFHLLAPHQLMALDHYHAYRTGRLYMCPDDMIYEATQRQVKADAEKEEKAHLAKQEKNKQMAAALSGSKRKTKADATVATAAATAASAAAPDAAAPDAVDDSAAAPAAPNAAPTAAPAGESSARNAKRLRK